MSVLNPQDDAKAFASEIDKSVATLAQAIREAAPHLLDSAAGLKITITVNIERKPAV